MENNKGIFDEPEVATIQGELPYGADIAKIEASTAVGNFIQQAVPATVITNTDQLKIVQSFDERAIKGMKYIDGLFADSLTKAKMAKAAAEATRSAIVMLAEQVKKPLSEYHEKAVTTIKAYVKAEIDRKTDLALQEEKKRLAVADQLKKSGDTVGAKMVEEFAQADLEAAKVSDISLDKRTYGLKWKARVIDIVQLCAAVADRQVEAFAVEANISWLNGYAKLNHNNQPVPGVEFFEE